MLYANCVSRSLNRLIQSWRKHLCDLERVKEAASGQEVNVTETALNDFDTLLDYVTEATGELGWDGFAEQDENDAEDDEAEEEDDERSRSFQLHEMEKTPRGTTGDDTRGDLPRDCLFGFRGFKKPLRNSRTESFCRQG
jgi:hypothetical protein